VTVTVESEPVTTGNVTVIGGVCSDIATGYNLTVSGAATYNISTNSNGLVQSAGTVSAGTGKLELVFVHWSSANSAAAACPRTHCTCTLY